jgi:hypothetical protein
MIERLVEARERDDDGESWTPYLFLELLL